MTLRLVKMMHVNVDEEIEKLLTEIKRLGQVNAAGKTFVKFGILVRDDRCADIFEGLVGTLKAAKKRKIIHFEGEILLQGAHDAHEVTIL